MTAQTVVAADEASCKDGVIACVSRKEGPNYSSEANDVVLSQAKAQNLRGKDANEKKYEVKILTEV